MPGYPNHQPSFINRISSPAGVTGLFFLLMLCLQFFVIGIHYNESGGRSNFWLSGSLMGEPYTEYYMKDFYLISEVVGYLFRLFPLVPWLSISFLFFILSSCAVILYSVIRICGYLQSGVKHTLLCTIPLSAFLLQNLLFIDHTTGGFLLATASVTYLIQFLIRNPKHKAKHILIYTLLFLLSVLVRNEAAVGVLVIALPVMGLLFLRYRKQLIPLLIPYGVILLLYNGLFNYHLRHSTAFYYQIEPNFEYELMDLCNIVKLSEMKTAQDSIGYWAVKNWMIADSSTTPPAFIRSLIAKPHTYTATFLFSISIFSPGFLISRLSVILKEPIVWLLVLVCIYFCVDIIKVRKWLPFYFLYTLFWLLVLARINDNFHERFSLPLLSVFFSLSLFFIRRPSNEAITKGSSIIGVLLFGGALFALLFSAVQSYAKSSEATVQEAVNQSFFRQINALDSFSYVVWVSDGEAYNTGVFSTSVTQNRQPVPIDFVQYSYTDQTKRILRKVTGCPDYDFLCRFVFLKSKAGNVLVVGSRQRALFYKDYLLRRYAFSIELMPTGIRHPNGIDEVFVLR